MPIHLSSPLALPRLPFLELHGDAPVFIVSLAPLLLMLAIAAVLDCRTRRIPNWLTLGLLGLGLLRGMLLPWLGLAEFGLGEALLGALAGFALSVPLFAIGARGGGDAKLYIACGAWLGWSGVLLVFVIEAIVGLVMVLAQCAWRGRLIELFRNTGVLMLSVVYVRRIGVEQARENATRFTSIDQRLPHAVPFLAAALLALLAAAL